MKKKLVVLLFYFITANITARSQELLIYHNIKTDKQNNIIPWFNPEPGISYDFVLDATWKFWDTMRRDLNGLPYYMNHQVWNPVINDPRGLGGDQFNMALSSWLLYYQYTGNEKVKDNMRFIADYYLTHSLSPSSAQWPSIPFPYNTYIYSGIYDGDMIIGKDFTQPDKAGSFGLELVKMYKMMSQERYPNVTDQLYLDAAIAIANTLASHTKDGDENNSPLPFKVNAITGAPGILKSNNRTGKEEGLSNYTSNWCGTLELFLHLQQIKKGDTVLYKNAFEKIISWMKKYPLQNNKWGPFFEDIPGWSDTQINAVTFAQFIMNHREYFPEWKAEVRKIFNWVYEKLGNKKWEKYGVVVVNEQTAYQVPGNSHTSRQASAELQYIALTADSIRYTNAVRQLNWATYMVNEDGRNKYPQDENWLTDGYGDYLRHYLRAMGFVPSLAPSTENHLLFSSSIVQHVFYEGQFGKYYYPPIGDTTKAMIYYDTYDENGTEILRLLKKPSGVLLGKNAITENNLQEGYNWQPLASGGILTIKRMKGRMVTVLK